MPLQAGVTITDFYNALVDLLISSDALQLTDDSCNDDIDKINENFMGEDEGYGCLVMFGGGSRQTREVFRGFQWTWRFFCFFLLRYRPVNIDEPTIEEEVKIVSDTLKKLFDGDHTLGNLTPKAEIAAIDLPETENINNQPYYFIPFTVEIWDKS